MRRQQRVFIGRATYIKPEHVPLNRAELTAIMSEAGVDEMGDNFSPIFYELRELVAERPEKAADRAALVRMAQWLANAVYPATRRWFPSGRIEP